MKALRWLWIFPVVMGSICLASDGVDDVMKLQRAGIDRDVMLAYVNSSSIAYNLSADEIQRLEDGGVPPTVVVAMIDHGKQLRGESTPASSTAPVANNSGSTNSDKTQYSTTNTDRPRGSYDDGAKSYATAAPVDGSGNYVPVAPPDDGRNVSLFYEALAPHGTWYRDSHYGWVWQPTIVSTRADWRPYSFDGHWVWTDQGWYWESSYPWGWAAFHYGRWYNSPDHQWVWVPDTVWGPAWVDWRQSPEYLGWAPLPPEARFDAGVGFSFNSRHVGFDFHFGLGVSDFAFVPAGAFLEADIGPALLPASHVTRIYNQTTVVNNTYVYNDNRVINQGVPTTTVARATNRQIQAVQIADANLSPGQPIVGERRSANKILTYRPQLANTAPVEPPAIVRRQQAVVHARQQEEASARNHLHEVARQSASTSTADGDARRALGKNKNNLESTTGESRPVVNREVQREHLDAVDAEREARRRLADEKSRRHDTSVPPSAVERKAVTPELPRERRSVIESEPQSRQQLHEEKSRAPVIQDRRDSRDNDDDRRKEKDRHSDNGDRRGHWNGA